MRYGISHQSANPATQFGQPVDVPVPAASPAVERQPQPVRTNVRPEAAGGLDGWLVDRLFGGH